MRLDDLHAALPANATVLDVGCLSFIQRDRSLKAGRHDVAHYGVDYVQPAEVPHGFQFKLADLNDGDIPFEDDTFDLVVASHVIEHLDDPVRFFGDCMRVCKPGGLFYIEAPSERSLLLCGYPFFTKENFHSLSFYDDPTHSRRPFTRMSFVRLAMYYQCDPLEVRYDISWVCRLLAPIVIPFALLTRKGWLLEYIVWKTVGWSCYALVRKPKDIRGKPEFDYYIPDTWKNDMIIKVLKKIKGNQS